MKAKKIEDEYESVRGKSPALGQVAKEKPPRIIYEEHYKDSVPYSTAMRIVLIEGSTGHFIGVGPALFAEMLEKDSMGADQWVEIRSAKARSGLFERALLSKEGVDIQKLIEEGRLPG